MKIKSLFIIACAMMFTLSLSAQTRKGTTAKRPTTASKRPAQQTASKPILVDLGLPSGTKWADRNIGATSVTSVGGYYSYGETATKQIYTSDTYTFKSDITNIAGTEYDVATKKYGKGWSIPTAEQWKELFESCTLDYMVINKLYVAKFTGPNGKSIYLYFPPNDIYARGGNMEMSKQLSAILMSDITKNETFVNLSQLAQYNGITVKATEALYRTANKESLAQILAIISVEKNGKVNPSLKYATVNKNVDDMFFYLGLLVRPVFNSPKTESTEDTEQDEIELPE